MIEISWGQRSFFICAGSRKSSFDEGAYVLDHGLLENLPEEAVLRQFVWAHSKKSAPMTKAQVTEMIIANLDDIGGSHGFPRPSGFFAPV
jgi:hypothetical protein